jgi:transcription antitermination factor NusG
MSNIIRTTSALAPAAVPVYSSQPWPESHPSPEWFAVYTTSRHEKRVAEYLAVRKIESFLPLYSSLRRWNNGCKVKVELPLFPGYVFVRVNRHERVRVLEIPGVRSFVNAGSQPASLPETEMEALRAGLQAFNCEPHPYLVVGERARIKNGALAGLEGILVRKKGALRVVISLDLIMKGVAIEVDATDIEPIGTRVARPLGA